MLRSILLLIFTFGILGTADRAFAQAESTDLAGCRNPRIVTLTSIRFPVTNEQGTEELRIIMTGSPAAPVQIDCDDMQLFADKVEVFQQHVVVATGNVVFVSGDSRIAAGRLEFDTRTKLGTFFDASGTATLGERVDRSLFGTQEPDAYFWGQEIEKVGLKKYKITRGGFTTCIQPTPRWEISSGTVTLNLDDYALLTNSVFKVKGVPLLYLPVFYYPIQEDDRATGFLIPTYGSSTVRGPSLSNAFFWAINRSQDATFFHDWFTDTGQGVGGEYRYEMGGGSSGSTSLYMLNEHETTTGAASTTPAKKSYRATGGMTQALGRHVRARANVDYFSDIITQQRYQQNVYQATNRTRRFGGNVTANWNEYVLSGTLERHDVFYNQTDLTTTGGLPRINFNRGERPIGRSKIYFGVNGEYVTQLWSTKREDLVIQDRGLTRFDVNPVLRIPFTKWPFLTLNSTVAWRGTYWTESLVDGVQVPEAIGRRYFDFQSRITGPVFNKIFNTPGGGYAEKFKHVIEPTLTIQRITAIDNFDEIVKLDSPDSVVGSVTRLTYGINNRLYAKKAVSREILNVAVTQTYYTDARAAQYDAQYQSSFNGNRPTNFSAVRLVTRVSPTDRIQGEFSTEWDPTVHTLRTFAANGIFNHSDWLQTAAGWSQRRFIADLPGFNDPNRADHYLNASTTVRALRNKVGGTYQFNYDLRRDTFLQQRYLAYYNAQCCGVGFEYQTFNFSNGFGGLAIPQDRRFNISFTLAGIGTFSNLFGAFGGQQGR